MQRGDVVLADLEPVQGVEADKARPVVLVGNDASLGAAIRHGGGGVIVVPVTTNPAIRGRMHVALRPTRLNGLRSPSKAQVEQLRWIDVNRLRTNLGRLDEALRYHLVL